MDAPLGWLPTEKVHNSEAPFRQACRTLKPFLPEFGQKLAVLRAGEHPSLMRIDPGLIERIAASTGLTAAEAARVIGDVVAFHAEPVEEYVRRRHAELKTYGARNDEIFARIAGELADRVVAAPALTERQLRRLVYG
jgi:hypothetical protein